MCKEKRIVYLAGIGMGTKEGMTVQAKESLKGCDCMIGAKRLLEEVSDADCVCHAEYLPEKIEEYLRKHPQFCMMFCFINPVLPSSMEADKGCILPGSV